MNVLGTLLSGNMLTLVPIPEIRTNSTVTSLGSNG